MSTDYQKNCHPFLASGLFAALLKNMEIYMV